MLIKIKQDSLSIVKHSMTTFEKEYINFIKYPTNVTVEESTGLINIKGSKADLFRVLYMISEKCDIELM